MLTIVGVPADPLWLVAGQPADWFGVDGSACQQSSKHPLLWLQPHFPFTVWILQPILNPTAKHVLFHLLPSEMKNRWPCINLTRKIMMTGKSGHEPKQNCQAHRRCDYSSPYVLSLTERDNSMQVSRSTQRLLQTDLMIHKAEWKQCWNSTAKN